MNDLRFKIHDLRFRKGSASWQVGFTLIELMVVLTIIGIVSGIIISSSMAIRRSGRDAVRNSDLSSIQSSLEQYHADYGYYPYELTFGEEFSQGGKVYLSKVPNDPVSGNAYSYLAYKRSVGGSHDLCDSLSFEDCVNYCIYATLENKPPQALSDKGPCSLVDKTENFFVTAP